MARLRHAAGFVLALFALLAQLLAPIDASLAMATMRGALDAPICATHTQNDGSTPDKGSRHDSECPVCQACCHRPHALPAAATPRLPLPSVITFVASAVAWPGLPRAPPRIGPYARAPPATS